MSKKPTASTPKAKPTPTPPETPAEDVIDPGDENPKAKPKRSLRDRASALLAKARVGPTVDPKVLKKKADARLRLVVARLESVSGGAANYPPSMVRWWREVELPALLNGTWSPHLRNFNDARTNKMFGLLAAAGVPADGQTANEAKVDDLITGADE